MLNSILRPFVHLLPESNRLERIWVLAKTDFLKRYYGSVLGLFWALLNPVFQFIVYYLVFTIVFKPRVEQYALFLFLGLILYLFFVEAGQKGLILYKSKKYILENVSLPLSDIYAAGFLSVLYGFLFNIIVFLVAAILTGAHFSIYAIYLPIVLLPLFLFALAIKIILSIVSVYLEDMQHVWDIIRLCVLWFSGVFFPIDVSAGWKWAALGYSSPIPAVLHNARSILIYGGPIDWQYLLYSLLYASVLFSIAIAFALRKGRLAVEKV